MFKLVVLSALVALTVAAPSGLHGLVAAPILTAHSAVVGSVPTSISQQSTSVVHRGALVSPAVYAAPAVAYSHAAPAVAYAHAAPAVAVAAPILSAHSAILGSVPTSISQQSSSVLHSAALAAPTLYAAPAVYSTYGAHGVNGW